MDRRKRSAEVLNRYITNLYDQYKNLIKILRLESADIAAEDDETLSLHVELENESVALIVSLTKAVRTYLDQHNASEAQLKTLSEIESLKKEAAALSDANITALKGRMSGIKLKLKSIKLPQSARRVYYSGNNPTLMDIKI